MKSMLLAAGLVGVAIAGLILYSRKPQKKIQSSLPQHSRGAFAMG